MRLLSMCENIKFYSFEITASQNQKKSLSPLDTRLIFFNPTCFYWKDLFLFAVLEFNKIKYKLGSNNKKILHQFTKKKKIKNPKMAAKN